MIRSTKATPLATIPIVENISTIFTGHPPSTRGYERLDSFRFASDRLLQREVHRHGHDDRHRHAVEQRRRELPLLDGIERRCIEQRDRSEHFCFLHLTAASDRGL